MEFPDEHFRATTATAVIDTGTAVGTDLLIYATLYQKSGKMAHKTTKVGRARMALARRLW